MKEYDVYDILMQIMVRGLKSSPHGKEILEIPYFQGYIICPWSSYPARKYPIDYFKREMQWYLGANPYDNRICKHAKMWLKIRQDDGRIFSNYGYYWFNKSYLNGMSGFDWVIHCLKSDRDSRQAYIPMNGAPHAFIGNKDFVCTKGIQFRIINNTLHCHVAMRSSDAIYGLATDLPCFFTLWAMVAVELQIECGDFVFSADSLHVYEQHFDMVHQLLDDGKREYIPVGAPGVESASDLIEGKFESEFGKWLLEAKL